MNSKYLIVGAGGTGGAIAGVLGRAGNDVTLIARGEHLAAMKDGGMTLMHVHDSGEVTEDQVMLKAASAEEYKASGETPDVIFICTKSYSIADVAPFIDSVAGDDTIIIPILNGLMMGDYIRGFISKGRAIDGCIYIFGMKDGPGRSRIETDIFRVVFGQEDYADVSYDELKRIEDDLTGAGVSALATDDIISETIRKFSFITPSGGTMFYFDSCNGKIRETAEQLAFFEGMVSEIVGIAETLGKASDIDLLDVNRKLLFSVPYESTSSLIRDIQEGHESEFDMLIKRPYEIGTSLGVDMPYFAKVIEKHEGA